ncbi:MAG: hypothetical protein QW404_00530 [Candidatus Nanoarchaeia archaeon]
MQRVLRGGLIFGLTSGVITTLGLMVGMHSGTHSKLAVIGAILTIAVADAFSDSLGMHLSGESEDLKDRDVRKATISTFISKLLFPLTFIIPILLFQLTTAMIISVIWGLMCIGLFSYKIAKIRRKKPTKVISEHIIIAGVVIVITHFLGDQIYKIFMQ